MKNTKKVLGIIAISAIIGFSFTACGGNGAGAGSSTIKTPDNKIPEIPVNQPSAAYESKDSEGNIYLLEITKASGRAAYAPANGDTYILTVISTAGEIKKSKGTVAVTGSSGVFSLTPTGSTKPFTVTISGENMGAIEGTILTDKGEIEAPEDLNPVALEPKTVELKAHRYNNGDGSAGEEWASGQIKLYELTTVIPRKGLIYRFKVSGTTDTTLKWFGISFGCRTNNWSEYKWLGSSGESEFSGTFNHNFNVNIQNDPLTNPEAYCYIDTSLGLWHKGADGSYAYDPRDRLPADVEEGTLMATITNFKIMVVEITEQ